MLQVVGMCLCLWQPRGASAEDVLVETKLVASDGGAADQFGSALAVSGDVLVSTAPYAAPDGRRSAGAAHVFLRDATTTTWTEQKLLLPHDGTADDQFGINVAIDGETLVVGAPNARIKGTFQQGAVYIFQRHQGGTDNWGEVIKLTDDSVGFGGHFGSAISIQGDQLVVGASEGSTRHGRVTLFERNRGGADAWGAVTTIYYSAVGDAGNVVSFGSAVALDGDLLLVGAANSSVSYVDQADGAAYLFRRAADVPDRWDYVTRLITPGADRCANGLLLSEIWLQTVEVREEALRCATEDSQTDNDDFGYAVALDGDIAVVGARFAEDADGNSSVGAVYVFQGNAAQGDQWSKVAKLAPADASTSAYFGSALALAGDTVVVGAHGADIGPKRDKGAAYVFQRDAAGSWGELEKLIAGDGLSLGYFGTAVGLDREAPLVGAKGADNWRGAVYFHQPAEPDEEPTEPPPAFEPTGELVDDGVVEGPGGALLGAVETSLGAPLPVWIREVEAPPEPLSVRATVRSPFYNVGAVRTMLVVGEPAFAVALPIPQGADPSHIAAAVLVPAGGVIDDPAAASFWTPVLGVHDPESGLLVVGLDALLPEGATIVLIEHPDLAPVAMPVPVTAGTARAASDSGPIFELSCYDFPDPSPVRAGARRAV